jgi:tetratricopeptide (TPR) repeat protein
MMVAKGFAALALASALAVIAVVGLGSCSSSGTSTTTPSLPVLPDFSLPAGGTPSLATAKAGFEQTLKRNPRDPYAWYNLAVIAVSDHDSKTAIADYERAIAIQPNFQSALYNLGLVHMRERDYPAAATLLHRAAAANPNDANARFNLGLALANLHTAAADAWSKSELAAARNINPGLFKGRLYGSAGPTSTTRGR